VCGLLRIVQRDTGAVNRNINQPTAASNQAFCTVMVHACHVEAAVHEMSIRWESLKAREVMQQTRLARPRNLP